MTECFIFDIDGTLADCQHRRHLVEIPDRCAHGFVFELRRFYNCEHKCVVPKKDWDKFFALAHKDPVIEPVATVLRTLQTRYPIIIVSARRESERQATLKWLRQNNLWSYPWKLYLREVNDKRDDDVFKQEVLNDIIASGFKPLGVFDDRKRVVDMWRRNGLMCFQVAEGNF